MCTTIGRTIILQPQTSVTQPRVAQTTNTPATTNTSQTTPSTTDRSQHHNVSSHETNPNQISFNQPTRTNPAQAVATPQLDVSKMGNKDKIVEAIKGSLKYVAPELRAKIEAMLTPENLTKMGTVLGAYVAAHAVGIGEIADGALFLAGAVALGQDSIDVAKKLYGFAKGAVDAKTPQELDQASRQLGSAMATVASDIPALIGMKNTKPAVGRIPYPTIEMRPVMSGNGVAVGVPSMSWASATVQGAQISRANAAAIGSTTMMSVGSAGGPPKSGPNGTYEDAPYHSSKGNSVKNPKPTNGQEALDKSLPLGGTSKRRIAFVNDEIVILDQTSVGKFHGHVRKWAELENDMRSVLIKNNIFKPNGKLVK